MNITETSIENEHFDESFPHYVVRAGRHVLLRTHSAAKALSLTPEGYYTRRVSDLTVWFENKLFVNSDRELIRYEVGVDGVCGLDEAWDWTERLLKLYHSPYQEV